MGGSSSVCLCGASENKKVVLIPEYRQARQLAKIARKAGTLRGVLWQHGSSHSMLPFNEQASLIFLSQKKSPGPGDEDDGDRHADKPSEPNCTCQGNDTGPERVGHKKSDSGA